MLYARRVAELGYPDQRLHNTSHTLPFWWFVGGPKRGTSSLQDWRRLQEALAAIRGEHAVLSRRVTWLGTRARRCWPTGIARFWLQPVAVAFVRGCREREPRWVCELPFEKHDAYRRKCAAPSRPTAVSMTAPSTGMTDQ